MVYGEFETLALLADGTFEGTGLESAPIGPIEAIMNVVNSSALIFDTIEGFFGWPVGKPDGSSMVSIDNDTVGKVAKYSVSLFFFSRDLPNLLIVVFYLLILRL